MSRWPDRWIVVQNWRRFQHYHGRGVPPWIKNYRDLLHKDEYLDEGLAVRGLLHGMWLAYADYDGRLRTVDIPHALRVEERMRNKKATEMFLRRSLERLNHAGFIGFSASKPSPLSLLDVDARARANGRAAFPVCSYCEVGGGLHAADCPTVSMPA